MRVGIDVVSKAHIAADVERWGDLFLRGPLTSDEERWCREIPHPAGRLAVCLAVKEAAVKALGGRPPGFHWHDVELLPWHEACRSTVLDLVVGELALAVETPVERRPCRLRASACSAVTAMRVPIAAAWAGTSTHLVAVVTMG